MTRNTASEITFLKARQSFLAGPKLTPGWRNNPPRHVSVNVSPTTGDRVSLCWPPGNRLACTRRPTWPPPAHEATESDGAPACGKGTRDLHAEIIRFGVWRLCGEEADPGPGGARPWPADPGRGSTCYLGAASP